MTGWASLPAELRLIIWQYAAMDYCPTPPRLGSLAAVCEEWKEHFEMRNFASITIQAYEIDKFGLIIERNRRLGHLRHLRLHINIPEYDCEQSTRPESRNSAKMHEEMFTSALFSLIDVLSILEETSRCRGPPGFTLEISASSPSDSKHSFQSYFRLSEAYNKLCRHYPEQPDLPCKQLYFDNALYEKCRNWHEVEEHSFQRVHGRRPLKLRINPHASQIPRTPRVVNMVTGLLTRRQYYRSVSMSALSFLIRNCFPNLVNIRLERWQAARLQHPGAPGFLKGLLDCSKELQSLHIFEDRSTTYEIYDLYSPATDLGVSKELWRISQLPKLQSFSACSIIDASDFFSHFADSVPQSDFWPELKNLCLTAHRLMPDASRPDFCIQNEPHAWKLLTDATRIASLMPKLQVLELWHAENEKACLWTYYKTESRARLMVRGGEMHFELHEQPDPVRRLGEMAKTWAKYATELLGRETTCELLLLPSTHSVYDSYRSGPHYYSPRDIVRYLELAGAILHPTSLHQMKWESYHEPMEGRDEPFEPYPPWTKEQQADDIPSYQAVESTDTESW